MRTRKPIVKMLNNAGSPGASALVVLIILCLSSCNSIPIEISPIPTFNLPPSTPMIIATNTFSIPITPALTKPAKQTATSVIIPNAPETLGTIEYLQYPYSISRSYEYGSCTSCPVIYYALLFDVHNWMFIQATQTAWLEFNLESKYQVRSSEENDTVCAVAQNVKNINLVEVTCSKVGEHTLKFDIVDTEQHLTYPLILHFVSVSELSHPPVVIPPEISVEEYELRKHPSTDDYFFVPVTGSAASIQKKHEVERGQPVEGAHLIRLDNGQLIQVEETSQATGLSDPSHILNITITQNGNGIFTMQSLISPISAFRGLWSFENHWFAEIIAAWDYNSFRSFTKGDIFMDGKSINETHSYTESFGFQLLHGRPFYFFEKDARIGVSYDGQEIPLGYDRVPHHGCCSASFLNPKTYENMVIFLLFAGTNGFMLK